MTVRFGLEGRSALVTGATSAVGSMCVERLCDEGMAVAFTGPSRGRGESIARATGGTFIESDPLDRAGIDRAVEQSLDGCGGRLDVLVTNAEAVVDGSIEATSETVFRELIEANLTCAFRVGRRCLSAMRARGAGSMIHIASDAGMRAAHETAAYSVTSAGVIAMAELFGVEGAPDGVRANAVCPGLDATPPSGTLVTGTDVASLVAWLACDESAHMTGATLRIDGGAGAAMLLDTRT